MLAYHADVMTTTFMVLRFHFYSFSEKSTFSLNFTAQAFFDTLSLFVYLVKNELFL